MNLVELNINQLQESKITECIITKSSKERLLNRYKLLKVLNGSKEKYFIVLEEQHRTQEMQNIEVVIFPFSVTTGTNPDLLEIWHLLSDEEKLILEESTKEGLAREVQHFLDAIIEDLAKLSKKEQILLTLIGKENVSFCSNYKMIEWGYNEGKLVNNLEDLLVPGGILRHVEDLLMNLLKNA